MGSDMLTRLKSSRDNLIEEYNKNLEATLALQKISIDKTLAEVAQELNVDPEADTYKRNLEFLENPCMLYNTIRVIY